MNNELPNRKNLQLRQFDYNTPGAYFVTVCTHNKQSILSHIVGAIHESPLRSRSTLSKIIGYIKMNASKEIHQSYGQIPLWQRGFHDHIIRNQQDYDMISKYVNENPLKWQNDCFYTEE